MLAFHWSLGVVVAAGRCAAPSAEGSAVEASLSSSRVHPLLGRNADQWRGRKGERGGERGRKRGGGEGERERDRCLV